MESSLIVRLARKKIPVELDERRKILYTLYLLFEYYSKPTLLTYLANMYVSS